VLESRWPATEIVSRLTQGTASPESAEELLALAYDELHRLATAYMRRERNDHTLQPTALLHEAYVKLVDRKSVDWTGKQHFVAVAAQAMRRILIDHARGHGREKRGGQWARVTLGGADRARSGSPASPASPPPELGPEELLSLDAALCRLAELDPRQGNIVELRFFGGLSVQEVAEVLGVSRRTVEGDWSHARAWLRRELSRGSTP
jgi:RNA polymerase sigma factor (TIGR02999 family)